MLNSMATVIQRHWRGYRARHFAVRFLVERVNLMWQNFYDRSATLIQATWRGYWTRKNGIDIQRMRNWFSSIYKKNEQIQEQMKKSA